MEPVHAESGGSGEAVHPRYDLPGTVRISPEKQQMIGVRVEKVERSSHGHTLRTLGRVAADENLVYRVITNTDGWVRDVKGCTTGSLVRKDQVLAQINTYSVDFYTWQQQYLTYTAYQRPPGSQPPIVRLPRARQAEGLSSEPRPERERRPEAHVHDGSDPAGMDPSEASPHGMDRMEGGESEPEQPEAGSEGAPRPQARQPEAMSSEARQDHASQTGAQGFYAKQLSTRSYLVDNNAYRAKLELLNAGLKEEQLEDLARTGQYQTQVEIRSPVAGFVLSRAVSPWQKSEKGAELFRIADLSRIWVLADVFERDAPMVRPGTAARVWIPHQGRSIEARVTEVLPQFDTVTRTLKVRLEVDNAGFTLVPDMFVDVEFLIALRPAMTVPVDAVLDSGLTKTVFVDTGSGHFEPRSVTTGWRQGGRTEVVQGLMPGESIVVSGNFLVDSESRMKLAAAGLHGSLMKDPACGMEVYADKATKDGLTSTLDGSTVYFCSRECKALFDGRWGRQTGGPAPAMEHDSPALADADAMQGFWKDPVCGTILTADKARAIGLKSEYRGRAYYFCSEACRKQFEGSQQQFLEKSAAGHGPGHGGEAHD